MCDNEVVGLDDGVVSEVLRRQPVATIYEMAECFQERFHGQGGSSELVVVVQLVFLRKPDAAP